MSSVCIDSRVAGVGSFCRNQMSLNRESIEVKEGALGGKARLVGMGDLRKV